MALLPKLILYSPVSDENALSEFVEQCLRDKVSLIATVGDGCEKLEHDIDILIVGDGSMPGRFICTTSHPEEPLDEVRSFAQTFSSERGNEIQEVKL